MFVPGEGSYFSRLTLKFVEIVAAGVATAVSGYLVAHLSGYLSSPTPAAAVLSAPNAGAAYGSLRAPPAPAVSADAQGPAPQRNANPPAGAPAAAGASGARTTPVRKAAKTEARTTETKSRDAAETKPHDMKSIEAEVRAALADANANHGSPSHHTDGVSGPPAVGAPPRPVDDAALGGVAAMPRPTDVAPQPAQQAPVALAPPAAVDIKSLPVAGVDPSQPQQQPAAPAQEASRSENKAAANGLFSVFANLPNLLRSDTPRPDSEAPRPPMPIGQ